MRFVTLLSFSFRQLTLYCLAFLKSRNLLPRQNYECIPKVSPSSLLAPGEQEARSGQCGLFLRRESEGEGVRERCSLARLFQIKCLRGESPFIINHQLSFLRTQFVRITFQAVSLPNRAATCATRRTGFSSFFFSYPVIRFFSRSRLACRSAVKRMMVDSTLLCSAMSCSFSRERLEYSLRRPLLVMTARILFLIQLQRRLELVDLHCSNTPLLISFHFLNYVHAHADLLNSFCSRRVLSIRERTCFCSRTSSALRREMSPSSVWGRELSAKEADLLKFLLQIQRIYLRFNYILSIQVYSQQTSRKNLLAFSSKNPGRSFSSIFSYSYCSRFTIQLIPEERTSQPMLSKLLYRNTQLLLNFLLIFFNYFKASSYCQILEMLESSFFLRSFSKLFEAEGCISERSRSFSPTSWLSFFSISSIFLFRLFYSCFIVFYMTLVSFSQYLEQSTIRKQAVEQSFLRMCFIISEISWLSNTFSPTSRRIAWCQSSKLETGREIFLLLFQRQRFLTSSNQNRLSSWASNLSQLNF